ncbi:MAG: sulfate adenylyltransferase subunit CysN [Actinomycetota bacterium]|nr:sulfate adenylyltransferase subunit CysN [Actinomycetota bacterium]
MDAGRRAAQPAAPPLVRAARRGAGALDVDAFLSAHEHKSMLRFITCGSVDDGKSTLIGRLLYESKLVLDDQLAALEADSRRVGTQGGALDFALLVDGLQAEREQGITIDVAYRFFSTERRTFIVADTPGHEQYTRNMVTGASTADLAVILVDARKGVLTQTRRHSFLVSLVGIRQVVLAVNKLDLVGYDQATYAAIDEEYRALAGALGIPDVRAVPVSALVGDNLTSPSPNTPWYRGPDLMTIMEQAPAADGADGGPFRMPVQWVNRPTHELRGFAGVVTGGTVRPGDRVRVQPSGVESTVARLVTADGDLPAAEAGRSVTVTLADEVDVSRGDVLCAADRPAAVTDQIEAHVVWMAEQPMLPGRRYLLKLGTRTVNATVERPKYRIDVNSLEHVAARGLALNEIGVCNLGLDQPVALDPYADNRDTGGFILIDRITNATVGAGMVHFGLRRADNVHWQHLEVDADAHAALKGHRPAVVWLTGLSGAGKSTIANALERKLHGAGVHTVLLDGDNLRHGLSRDLGFTDADRVENIRRAGEVCKLMAQAGLVVIAAFISPFRDERQMVRDMVGDVTFVEVFVDTPLDVASGRDPKGLYAKARRGDLRNFTGVDSPYEAPESPEVRVDTTVTSADEAADRLVAHLGAHLRPR